MPLPQYPDFHLRETWGSAAVEYLGIAKLTAGLQADYVSGVYSGMADATQYHQDSAEFTAAYSVTRQIEFYRETSAIRNVRARSTRAGQSDWRRPRSVTPVTRRR